MKISEEPMTKVYVCSPFRPVSEESQRAEEEKQNNIKLAQAACPHLLCSWVTVKKRKPTWMSALLCRRLKTARAVCFT